MKSALLTYLVCPLCHSSLALDATAGIDDVIESGSLTCRGCGHCFAIHDGIPNMLAPDLPGILEKLGEVQGWLRMAQEEDWYTPDERLDLSLPYVVEELGWDPVGASTWVATRCSFEELLGKYVRPGLRVLEVGAAKSWAGRYFNARQCEYTACDIVDDPNIGLGRSRFFRSRFGHYEVVAADAEQLPFADSYFDLVFAIAALHHALDLPKMLGEMARVARNGAIVAGLNEAVRALRVGPNAGNQSKEKSYSINEHVHSLLTYRRAFRGNGLRVLKMTRAIGYDQLIGPRIRLGIKAVRRAPFVGDALAVWLVLGLIHAYDGVTIYALKT
jgi:uncharacterized protein YbaR (Trm112 family)